MNFRLVFLLTLLSVTAVIKAAQITIYRWVDDKNIVHFSQNQPEHDNYTEITMNKNTPRQDKVAKQITKEQKTQQENQNSLTASNAEKCLTAQNNLSTLESFDIIQYKTTSGESKVLSDKEKNDQLVLNKKQVDLYCGDQ